jgi:hypothetical protein
MCTRKEMTEVIRKDWNKVTESFLIAVVALPFLLHSVMQHFDFSISTFQSDYNYPIHQFMKHTIYFWGKEVWYNQWKDKYEKTLKNMYVPTT